MTEERRHTRPASLGLRVDEDVWAEVRAVVHWSAGWTLTLLVEYALSARLEQALRRGGLLVDPYTRESRWREPGEAYPEAAGACPPGPVQGSGVDAPSPRTTLYLPRRLVDAWWAHVYWSPPHSAREEVTAALRDAIDLINASPQPYKRGSVGRIKPPGEGFPAVPSS